MKIAIVSKADSAGGEASKVAQDLAEAFNEVDGHEAIHINTWRSKTYSFTRPLFKLGESYYHRLRNLEKRFGFVDYLPFEYLALQKALKNFGPDVVHFHDISSAYSPKTLEWISKRYNTHWTFHDVSPLTGGCLYPAECIRFADGCGGCPQLGHWPINTNRDKTKTLAKQKKRILDAGRIKLQAPSKWLSGLAKHRLNVPVTVISNGIETSHFRTLSENERTVKRKQLGLSTDKHTIVWICSDFADARKGAKQAIQVIQGLHREIGDTFQLILMGNTPDEVLKQVPDLDIYVSGYVSDPILKAELYQLADSFLFTSLEDNQPLTVLEALAAGLRVLGFRTGGIPELDETFSDALHLVHANETGKLIKSFAQTAKKKLTLSARVETQKLAAKHLDIRVAVNNQLETYKK
jgi:glycosyltransferase involved in cell wall biosynthesis